MIKKYYVDANSVFNTSLVLSFYEQGSFGFYFDGLDDCGYRDLFPVNRIKFKNSEVDYNSVPTRCVVAYLDDDFLLKAFVLKSCSNKYYLFKVDHQKEQQLNIHQKYISNDLNYLLKDYEDHCKKKGKSLFNKEEGAFSLIKDINYFEKKYESVTNSKINKTSSVYRLLFESNNMFTVDFADLVSKDLIVIENKEHLDRKALTLDSMQRHKNNRKDCLFIDSETKDIKYFIFTYRPNLINHYFLLKNLGDDKFEFVLESISFNRILSCDELKDLTYKKGSAFAAKEFAKMRYDNFYLEYVAFEEEEEIEEEIRTELELSDEIIVDQKDSLLDKVKTLIAANNALDVAITHHGKSRIDERIGEMNSDDMLALAKAAFEYGKTSVHFLENDPAMFKFMQYNQNKTRGKTLKLFEGVLFVFAMEPPHELITCFPCKEKFEMYMKHEKSFANKHHK